MRLESGPGTHVVRADRYRLEVRDGAADLADADGRRWSRLSLLAGVHRVDVADESYAIEAPRVVRTTSHGAEAVDIEVSCRSTAWPAKRVRLRCFEDHLELHAEVEGAGTLTDVQLLGGRAVMPSGACGVFRSSIEFRSVFSPGPAEPVQFARPATAAATLGVVGDASPGRLHGIFSPPPLCLAFGRDRADHPTQLPGGDWLSVGLDASVADLHCTEMRYQPLDNGFLLELDYDGHTTVTGSFRTPTLVLRPAGDPWQALDAYRHDLATRGPAAAPPTAPAAWWAEPIFCGWGAQCAAAAAAGVPAASELSRQAEYDRWLERLGERGIVPGTVVIDDRWQAAYGTGDPAADRWPDLRAWIADRHAAGQRVLLWWKAWDPDGLPADECVLDPSGAPVAADPGSPAYLAHLDRIVTRLVAPGGYDADGFKIDFTQRAPAGHGLKRPGAPPDAPWGIAALHLLLGTIHRAAKRAKPDALLVTQTPHPGFGDVCDMVRLNDILDRDATGAVAPAADQLPFRHAVARAALPDHLIDTDQWPIADRAQWRAYVRAQARLGVPALYYAERIDGSGEELTDDDLALVAQTWRDYRAGLRTAR